MKTQACLCAILFAVLIAVPASSDDRQKAEKQIKKITAMATDVNVRRIVSRVLTETVKVSRDDLARERRNLNLSYGSLFVAHELARRGMTMTDIATQIKAGRTIWQLGDDRPVDWKEIAAAAKKLNSRIDASIYNHFASKKNTDADEARDRADTYDPLRDAVKADFDVTREDIVEAQNRYVFWRDRAAVGTWSGGLDRATEKAAYLDHASGSRPGGATPAPAAGGLPPQ